MRPFQKTIVEFMPFASWRSWCRWVVDLCFLALESRKRPEVMGDDYPGFFSLVRTPTKWGPLDFLEVLFSTISYIHILTIYIYISLAGDWIQT